MLTIYLVSCGETDLSANGELLGLNNPALNARGIRYSEDMAERFSSTVLEAVYSGPMKREVVTARRIAKPHDIPVRVEKRLRDINYGSWSGKTWESIQSNEPKLMEKFMNKPNRFRFPSGDKLKRYWKRLVPFSNYIRSNYGTGHLIIVTDDFVSHLFASQLSRHKITDLEPWKPSRGGLIILECAAGICRLKELRGSEVE